MAAQRQLRHLFGRRLIMLGAFAVAAFAGALLSVWRTWQPESAWEAPPARTTKETAVRSEMPTSQADARQAQAAGRLNDDLTHDFGVVPPGSVVTWAYPIENTSDFAWTIERVHVLCRCTVPGASAPVIAPGKRESVTLQLDCGHEVADIVKAGTVYFKEPGAAPIRLLVKASVRASATPSAREISFGSISPGEHSERAVTLMNYGALDWGGLRVEQCPDWVEAMVSPLAATEARDAPIVQTAVPRQLWTATVKIGRQPLAEGYHRAPIHFLADTGNECEVYVSASVEAAVRIVPKSLVFGPARPSDHCQRVARIIVRKGLHVSAIRPTSDQMELSVDVRAISQNIWQLKAALVVPSDGRVPDGRLNLSFLGGDLPDAVLPYSFFQPADAQ